MAAPAEMGASHRKEQGGREASLHWVSFQAALGRTVGRVRSPGGIRTRCQQQQERSPPVGTGRITCPLEGLSGACDARCVLGVKLPVFPPRPSSPASILLALVTPHLFGPSRLCSGWWTLRHISSG